MPVRTWCQQQGTTWHTVFCDDVMRCVVTADQRCREEVCEGAPVAERATCQTRCLEYSQTSQRQEAVTFAQSMDRECGNFQQRSSSSSRNPLAGGVTIPGVNFSTECGEVATQQAEMLLRQHRYHNRGTFKEHTRTVTGSAQPRALFTRADKQQMWTSRSSQVRRKARTARFTQALQERRLFQRTLQQT